LGELYEWEREKREHDLPVMVKKESKGSVLYKLMANIAT
jgi:hypothetical protein